MLEVRYAKEPVDYKLAWLRFRKKIWILPVSMLLGALIVAGCHYFSKMIEKGGRTYETTSVFYIDFAESSDGTEYEFINYYTWGELIHSDYFMDSLYEALGGKYTREVLINAVTATIESDVRYLYVRTTTNSEAQSLEISKALEPIVIAFADEQKEFNEIKLSDKGDSVRDSTKLRLGNAAVLGAVLGLFVALFAVCVYITVDTGIYIPSTVERRYRIKTLGTPSMSEYDVNCSVMLEGITKLAYIGCDVAKMPEFKSISETTDVSDLLSNADAVGTIRACDGLVVGVKAGRRNDKMLERILDELERLDIAVTAIVLTDADEKLIKDYYKA